MRPLRDSEGAIIYEATATTANPSRNSMCLLRVVGTQGTPIRRRARAQHRPGGTITAEALAEALGLDTADAPSGSWAGDDRRPGSPSCASTRCTSTGATSSVSRMPCAGERSSSSDSNRVTGKQVINCSQDADPTCAWLKRNTCMYADSVCPWSSVLVRFWRWHWHQPGTRSVPLLLFDEADGLSGRRSEVNATRDR